MENIIGFQEKGQVSVIMGKSTLQTRVHSSKAHQGAEGARPGLFP
jgi:hypothetical protein